MGLPTKNNTREGVEYGKWKVGEPTGAPNGNACRSSDGAGRSYVSDRSLATVRDSSRARPSHQRSGMLAPPLICLLVRASAVLLLLDNIELFGESDPQDVDFRGAQQSQFALVEIQTMHEHRHAPTCVPLRGHLGVYGGFALNRHFRSFHLSNSFTGLS